MDNAVDEEDAAENDDGIDGDVITHEDINDEDEDVTRDDG